MLHFGVDAAAESVAMALLANDLKAGLPIVFAGRPFGSRALSGSGVGSVLPKASSKERPRSCGSRAMITSPAMDSMSVSGGSRSGWPSRAAPTSWRPMAEGVPAAWARRTRRSPPTGRTPPRRATPAWSPPRCTESTGPSVTRTAAVAAGSEQSGPRRTPPECGTASHRTWSDHPQRLHRAGAREATCSPRSVGA